MANLTTEPETESDPKVKIYVETAKEIFEMCRAKSKPDKNGSIYGGISEAITMELDGIEEFALPVIENRYLSNTSSRIETALKNNDEFIGFSHSYILKLAKFVGISNYVEFNDRNTPGFKMPVLFRKRPYSFFNLIRTPQRGEVSLNKNGWEFNGDAHMKIAGDVSDVNAFTMPGDVNPLWIEIKYNDGNGEQRAYFAEFVPVLKPVSESNVLFRFFLKAKNRV